ncbi:MAG: lactate utilization protein [Anaerolineales bacterium]|jgi:L-lactate utilization protein LutC
MPYNILPAADRLQKTIEAVRARGVTVTLVDTKESALAHLQALIPAGSSVMTGASITLQQIGFEALLMGGNHPWKYLKAGILSEKDPVKVLALRKQASLADYYLGSVHAIAETGEILIASATGSQLSAYAYSSTNIVWVAGTQKITPTLETAFQRVREYVLPLEDKHMKKLYGEQARSFIGKILLFESEAPYLHRTVNLLLVNEVLGF